MSARPSDPYLANHFCVSCEALPPLGFTEVRGLTVTVTKIDSETNEIPSNWGGKSRSKRRTALPERETDSPPLELRRGVTGEHALWSWLQDWVAGEVGAQDVCICLCDEAGDPVHGWVCRGATPLRWSGPTLVAGRDGVAMESLELVHTGIEIITDLENYADQAYSTSS